MNVRRNPLTPALSPLGWGEGDGVRWECLTLTLNCTRDERKTTLLSYCEDIFSKQIRGNKFN
jgi:hypothetical protein